MKSHIHRDIWIVLVHSCIYIYAHMHVLNLYVCMHSLLFCCVYPFKPTRAHQHMVDLSPLEFDAFSSLHLNGAFLDQIQ